MIYKTIKEQFKEYLHKLSLKPLLEKIKIGRRLNRNNIYHENNREDLLKFTKFYYNRFKSEDIREKDK